MSKNRQAIICNGRPAFYASMYEDIRKCAMDLGWAVALHGSLSSDMDIMAMPWVENAIPFENLIKLISELFVDNINSENYFITYNEKPHRRIVATIPIWEDYYLDISTIDIRKPMQEIVERLEKKLDDTYLHTHLYERFVEGEQYALDEAIEIVKEVGGMNG